MGKRFLGGYDTDAEQLKALMDNAVNSPPGLKLVLGGRQETEKSRQKAPSAFLALAGHTNASQ
jgi:hypothetical protein